MFTGIVERTAHIVAVGESIEGRKLTIGVEERRGLPPWRQVDIGESVCLSGACLTAVEASQGRGAEEVSFDVVPETLSKTTLGTLRPGGSINVERSLRVGDSFGGHYVTGHVDGTAQIVSRDVHGDQTVFRIATPSPMIGQVIPKGCVAVDGISLTVIDVDRHGGWFSFAAIPHTLQCTTLGSARVGDAVNVETDAFGKWVLHSLEGAVHSLRERDEKLRELLERSGFGTVDPAE